MEYSQKEMNGFFEAVESLKKYRRADLIDEKGRNLLKELYTDLLPNDFILQKSLKENTTFLIGRKGTGKSTIFLRLEQELREKKGYLPCYLDVKTIYEASQTRLARINEIEKLLSAEIIEKYLIERSFIQSILSAIIGEVSKKFDSKIDKLLELIGVTQVESVKEKLAELKNNLEDNKYLEKIEIPILQTIKIGQKESSENSKERNISLKGLEISGGIDKEGINGSVKTDSGIEWKKTNNNTNENEQNFSNVFLKVFQIKEIIVGIKEALSILKIRHLYILLDDFSEIEDDSIVTFVDVILAPLNNWSDEFIKFKVAAYPNRIYYGKIDPGKVDTINLDFYNLYSEFDRDKMESNAVGFTKKILEKRIEIFVGSEIENYFDTSRNSMEDYYEILFNASMNVPRILGYILSFCYQSRIIYNNKINKTDIENASKKYYEEKISSFFETTTHSLISLDEKISALQLKNLLQLFVNKSKDIKRKIISNDLKGSVYLSKEPYSSHFHFDPRYEDFLKTLELNFFISKYNDLSDKDGTPVSIYSLNYGLCVKENIIWGKPKGRPFRTYFIERPFSYNKIITEFLADAKRIICSNIDCKKQFDIQDLKFLEFNNYRCNSCNSDVIIETLADDITEIINKIDQSKMLPMPEVKILQELQHSETELYAKEIAQEVDYSGQLIGWRAKKLDEKHELIKREKEEGKPYKYMLTQKGKDFFTGK
ncbi:MarR family transcriptional regulator [Flavobacterium sp. F372]|uniref:MarR family transcriptional regulator n=1 Tax=Flavobacterium bernardetii TaxID=2813823 RepID=A0ABR7J2Q9_9FLAO|nr:MarR family transcriptional regulator [Flavobacterium bernardetii]MBC5836272.1 MarR family transcriptional regulator [Flavobacterium bernardetii]NHF71489.1 MarR family transcriptional regulator [Flavobacterium bernardetii]